MYNHGKAVTLDVSPVWPAKPTCWGGRCKSNAVLERSVLHHGWHNRTLRPASAPNPRLPTTFFRGFGRGFATPSPTATLLNRYAIL